MRLMGKGRRVSKGRSGMENLSTQRGRTGRKIKQFHPL